MRYPIILLAICFSVFCSCEKEVLEVPNERLGHPDPENTVDGTERSQAVFEYTINQLNCFKEKVALAVDIDNSEAYGYLWEINNLPGGHMQNPSGCHCGTDATVRIMRLSDGVTVSSTIELPDCSEMMIY